VDRALAKVEQAAGAAAGPAQRVEIAVEGEQRVLPVVRTALEQSRRLHLSYYVPGRDETTERDVDPMRLLLVEGRSYLEAWCRRAEGVRLFRLDRVHEVALLDLPSEPPADVQPRDLAQGLITLALRPGAAWVADYHPCESVTEDADGGLLVRLRARDTAWVRRLALRLGTSGRVVAPESLAQAVRDDAAAALAAYRSA
jgi:proteasome accessory factor C